MDWKTILVPHDFSASANHAAAMARDLAKLTRGRILLLHVIDLPYQMQPEMVIMPMPTNAPVSVRDYALATAEAHVQDLAKRLVADGVAASTFVRFGSPVTEILQLADDEKADVIVMGTHGRTGLRHLLIGSVAERVVRMSPHPVLTIRDPH